MLAWLRRVSDSDLHLAAITIAELQAGVENTRPRDPQKADEIEAWIESVAASFNVLPMDARCSRQWARLMHGRPHNLAQDAMIAATACVHHLIVVTRNLNDFGAFPVDTLNPFDLSPG